MARAIQTAVDRSSFGPRKSKYRNPLWREIVQLRFRCKSIMAPNNHIRGITFTTLTHGHFEEMGSYSLKAPTDCAFAPRAEVPARWLPSRCRRLPALRRPLSELSTPSHHFATKP